MITNLQRETKARVINALPPVGDSLWIAVSIIGDFKTVFDACKAISDIVEDGKEIIYALPKISLFV